MVNDTHTRRRRSARVAGERKDKHLSARGGWVNVKSTWLVLLSCREKSRCGACVAGDSGRWTMTLLII